MSAISTKPAVFIVSTRDGASFYIDGQFMDKRKSFLENHTNSRKLHINPIKLLSFAICTASLTEVVARPLLCTFGELVAALAGSTPKSLQSRIGSYTSVRYRSPLHLRGFTYNLAASNLERYRYLC